MCMYMVMLMVMWIWVCMDIFGIGVAVYGGVYVDADDETRDGRVVVVVFEYVCIC